MMKKLRGRNLSHPGCLVGITLGLTLGIVLAAILATLNVPLNADLLSWLGLTVLLGAIGWIIGNRLTSRFPALEVRPSLQETTSQGTGQPHLTAKQPDLLDHLSHLDDAESGQDHPFRLDDAESGQDRPFRLV